MDVLLSVLCHVCFLKFLVLLPGFKVTPGEQEKTNPLGF